MATTAATAKTRNCEGCGREYRLNPRYSVAQAARSRFCSRSCAGKEQPRTAAPLQELLGGVVRFGRLTVIGEGVPPRRARCRCDCGEIRDVQPAKLRSGAHRSCGCLAAESARARFTKHGGYRTAEYKSWNAMVQRCTNPNSTSFDDYGGRGISVAPEWLGPEGFLRFVDALGPRPRGTTLDRIDNHKGYELGNVRWAAPKVQQNNRRVCTMLTLAGVTRTQRQWTELRGWGKNVISERLKAGWTVERALTEPVEPRRRKVAA